VTEETTRQVLPTTTGFSARQAIAALHKREAASRANIKPFPPASEVKRLA
jgi:hypothetical protein